MNSKPLTKVCIALTTTALLASCAATNTEKGVAIGAAAGAILGKSTANHSNKRTILGAGIGAIIGGAIGSYMDKQEEELRQELSDTGIQVIREGDTLRLVMPSNITFATGQSSITSDFYPILDDLASVLTHYDKTILYIEGHTDDVGSFEMNQNLSEMRAISVRDGLLNRQVHPNRLATQGYGETRPLVANNSTQNRAMNRRVEIKIIPNEK